jgi:hypothetical protein
LITIRDARFDDVRDVMDKISDVSLEEMTNCGVMNAWQGLKRAKLCKDSGFLKVAFDGSEPLFIFGAATVATGQFRTWFIGTDKYFDPKNAKMIKATARVMEQLAKRFSHFSFEARTASRRDQVLRWFSLLGFNYVSREDGMMVFRYVGRKLAKSQNCAKFLT